jgi:hypothetical protein
MTVNKLWEKLFSRNKESDEIALHVSGATIRNKSPFEKIEVPRNNCELSKEFIDRWVIPFYMARLDDCSLEIQKKFAKDSKEINSGIISQLLGDFNWRSRIVGAFFCAINELIEFEEIIGRHLVKSEVCYAGHGYCVALAIFNTEKSKHFLKEYLDYYLLQKDLYFDQDAAYCALEFLSPSDAKAFIEKWNNFVLGKPNWDLDRSRNRFRASIETIKEIQGLKAV